MTTKAELEEQVAELEEALKEARTIIDTALGIETALCANINGTLRFSSIRVAGGEEYPS